MTRLVINEQRRNVCYVVIMKTRVGEMKSEFPARTGLTHTDSHRVVDRKRPEVPDGLTCYFWLQKGTTRQQDPEVTNSRVFVQFDAAEAQLLTPVFNR